MIMRRLARIATALDEDGHPEVADRIDGIVSEIRPALGPALDALRPQMAAAAQRVYDEWEQDEDGLDPMLGGGGICDEVSQAISGVIASSIPNAEIVDAGQDGDDHAWTVVHDGKQAFEVDIPPHVYETGQGYSWTRRPNVTIQPDDVIISSVPMEWMTQASEIHDLITATRIDLTSRFAQADPEVNRLNRLRKAMMLGLNIFSRVDRNYGPIADAMSHYLSGRGGTRRLPSSVIPDDMRKFMMRKAIWNEDGKWRERMNAGEMATGSALWDYDNYSNIEGGTHHQDKFDLERGTSFVPLRYIVGGFTYHLTPRPMRDGSISIEVMVQDTYDFHDRDSMTDYHISTMGIDDRILDIARSIARRFVGDILEIGDIIRVKDQTFERMAEAGLAKPYVTEISGSIGIIPPDPDVPPGDRVKAWSANSLNELMAIQSDAVIRYVIRNNPRIVSNFDPLTLIGMTNVSATAIGELLRANPSKAADTTILEFIERRPDAKEIMSTVIPILMANDPQAMRWWIDHVDDPLSRMSPMLRELLRDALGTEREPEPMPEPEPPEPETPPTDRMMNLSSHLDRMGFHRIADRLDRIAGYSSELGMLKDVLKRGFSPYDYSHMVSDFVDEEGDADEDLDEYGWIENASPERLSEFEDWVSQNTRMTDYYSPPYETMDYRGMSKPRWQVHFTDEPWDIASMGFRFGHPDVEGIHLTTHKVNRTSRPGFNFSFDADDKRFNENYGKHAVVFPSGAIRVYHHGDEEHQNVFWGPNVDPMMIFPINNEDGEWVVRNWDERAVFKSPDIKDCISWIETNWRQLIAVREKIDPDSRKMIHERKRRTSTNMPGGAPPSR